MDKRDIIVSQTEKRTSIDTGLRTVACVSLHKQMMTDQYFTSRFTTYEYCLGNLALSMIYTKERSIA